jgi:hypothetical protein
MADFGFVGASYVAPSIYQDASECINWRPEIDPTKGQGARGVVALYPTPGLTSQVLLSAQAQVRGMRTLSGGQYLVAVCGAYVYILTSNLTPTIVGQLNTSSGNVGITDNGLNVYITDGAYRYTWRISTPANATFNATISGTTLTVLNVSSGTIATGQALFGIGVPQETVIVSGSGTTWTLNNSATISTAETMTSVAVASVLTASISTTTLAVTATSGTLYPGQTIAGSGVTAGTIITALGSGAILTTSVATGGTGYAVNDTVTVVGGVYGSSPATYTVTSVSSGVVTGLTQTFQGQYTSNPTSPVSTTTSGSGTGLTLSVTFGTGTGSTGNYVINNSQSVGSETMYALNWSVLPSTDGAFQGADVVDIVDNYFIYNNPGTQQWAASNLLSPITYGLSYASKFTGPDNLVSIIADHGQIYLLGETTSEVWADAGTFPFAFQRIPGSSSQHGIAAKFSVARLGNSFAYLAKNNRGQSEIVMMNGYFPQRISTHAVENTLVNQTVSDAIAYTYQIEGHECYVISFPTIDLTWVYDLATQLWHKWLWVDNTNTYHRHRSNCAALFQNMVLVGDWQNGNIYELDPQNYTDNGDEIRRLRRCPHLVTDLQRQYFDELQIQFQPGVGIGGLSVNTSLQGNYIGTVYSIPANGNLTILADQIDILGYANQLSTDTTLTNPQAMLRWSNDGGSTWSREYWQQIGQQGKYKNRAIWRRLGMARDRIFEVSVSDPVKCVIVSANLKASKGDN